MSMLNMDYCTQNILKNIAINNKQISRKIINSMEMELNKNSLLIIKHIPREDEST